MSKQKRISLPPGFRDNFSNSTHSSAISNILDLDDCEQPGPPIDLNPSAKKQAETEQRLAESEQQKKALAEENSEIKERLAKMEWLKVDSKQSIWLDLQAQFKALQAPDSEGMRADWDGTKWTLCDSPESHKAFMWTAEKGAQEAGCGTKWYDWLSLLRREGYGYVPIRTPEDILFGKLELSPKERMRINRQHRAKLEYAKTAGLPKKQRAEIVRYYLSNHRIEVNEAPDSPEKGEICRVCEWSANFCARLVTTDRESQVPQQVKPESFNHIIENESIPKAEGKNIEQEQTEKRAMAEERKKLLDSKGTFTEAEAAYIIAVTRRTIHTYVIDGKLARTANKRITRDSLKKLSGL
jgi:hypothetical protein